MKRWFTALVCLVLVVSMVLPIPALAAVSTKLSSYQTSKQDHGSYTLYNYFYNSGSFFRHGYSDGGTKYDYIQSRTSTFDFSTCDSSYAVNIYAGFRDGYKTGNGSDGFLITDIIEQEYFKQLTFSVPVSFSSSVSVSVKVYCELWTLASTGASRNYDRSTIETITLSPGKTYSRTYDFAFTSFSSYEAAVVPVFILSVASPPSSGTITVDAYSFSATAKIGTGLPDFPVFSKNISGTYTYLKDEDSDVLSVDASVGDGGTLSYQWYMNSAPSTSGGEPVNTGKTCYPVTYFAGTSYYYCVVTNTLPNGQTSSSTSNMVTVHVIGPPKEPQITQNLGSAIIEYKQGDSSLALTVQAITIDGGTLSYQWYENNAPSTEGGTLISGATLCHYFPSTSEIGIKYYYCVVTNTISGYFAEATSSVAGIRVVSPPDPALSPKITTNLSTDEVVYITGTAAAALRIGASAPDGGELSYQWYSAASATAVGVEIPGATTASYTPETVVAGTTWYYCVVTNKLNDTSASVTSRTAMITVQDPPPETVPPQLDEMNDKLDDTNNFLDNIVQGILNLPQAILDGIKGLFVPDAEAMAAYQDQWSELLRTRFGAIYESVDVIGSFFETISLGDKQEEVVLPSVTVDLAGTPWTFGGWSVRVVPEGLEFLCTYSKLIVNIICTFAFINGLRNKFEGILGGA